MCDTSGHCSIVLHSKNKTFILIQGNCLSLLLISPTKIAIIYARATCTICYIDAQARGVIKIRLICIGPAHLVQPELLNKRKIKIASVEPQEAAIEWNSQIAQLIILPMISRVISGDVMSKKTVLDRAIKNILDIPHITHSPSSSLECLRDEVVKFRKSIDQQQGSTLFSDDIALLEQRMTSIFVASVLCDESDEHREIIETAGELFENLISSKEFTASLKIDQIKKLAMHSPKQGE